MARKIKWTFRAKANLDSITTYLTETWSEKVAIAVIKTVFERAELLRRNPELGVRENKEPQHIRSIVLMRQLRLYYRIKNEDIIILGIADTRQDPGKQH